MKNLPEIKFGIVAVSRDCFPMALSKKRRSAVVSELKTLGVDVFEVPTIVENERDVFTALEELSFAHINALLIYLGNFGPEGPETMLAQKFHGVTMFAAAAEETGDNLISGRGDAYCGMLNACYNLKLRGVNAYIPKAPVGTAKEVAEMAAGFQGIARAVIGVRNLKVITFGPRPQDFLACNAPIKPLFDMGIEVMENSELDLYKLFLELKDDKRIDAIAQEMLTELSGKADKDLIRRLANLELALTVFYESNLGASKFAVFANKCWPAFSAMFKTMPCYVNSRLAARGIPVACETDIYGAVSEFILQCVTGETATLLDINNTVPSDMYAANVKKTEGFGEKEMFMGFHCGNASACLVKNPELKYQVIMHRLNEPDVAPDTTRGTLEGVIKNGDVTIFRLQSSADCKLKAYAAEGRVLDIDPKSFGSIGVIAIPELSRFYRYVLLDGGYPHHTAVVLKKVGSQLFEVLNLLGINEIGFNRPASMLYEKENPFR